MFEETRALARQAADISTEAAAIRGIGLALQQAKDFPGATERFDEALRLYESIGDLRGKGSTLNSLGVLAWTQGNWKDLRRYFTAAADAFGEAREPAQQAQALRSLTFDREMSDSDRIEVLRRAWALVRSPGNERVEGLILHQWGDLLTNQGDYGSALEKLEAAAPLLDRAGTPLDHSNLATSLGRAYRLHGLPEQALPYFQKALAAAERSGDQRAISQGLSALAVVYSSLDRPAEALDSARRALESARASGNRPLVFAATSQLAERLLDGGRYAETIALLEPALAEPADVASGQEEVFPRVALARAYAGVGRKEEAGREADRAVSLGETDRRPAALAWALEQRARLRLGNDDAVAAGADAQRALDLVEGLRANLPRRDFLKQGFGETNQQLFALAIAIAVGRRDAGGALAVAERARARAFQDLLAARDRAALPGAGSAPADAFPSESSVEAPTLAEMRAIVARLGSPLLAYWVAPRETFIFVMKLNGEVEARRIQVEAARLTALAREASSGPTAAKTSGAPSSPGSGLRELHELLIAPVRPILQSGSVTRLTVIPHGPLFRVSFASLTDERGRYLIEQFELHYAPAAGVLRFTERRGQARGAGTALLVGDPVLPRPASGDAMAPLPGARLEIADAARRLGSGSTMLVGNEATEEAVRNRVAGQGLLHFATHGIVMDNDPLGSYLALASSGTEASNDGRLTTAEIYGLDLSADLVVLSACRSGAGKVTGDGIIGLTRAFFFAGAASVMATLWDLADEPAQFLMRRFYARFKAGGPKASALRAAQLELIRALREGKVTAQTPFGPTPVAETPAAWAAFVLLGEP